MSLASSRTRVLSTPASLRKELRHLSRELSSSDVPSGSSSRKTKAPTKLAGKENSRPAAPSVSESEWMHGGGVVAPAVFSFSGSPPPSHFNVTYEGAPVAANFRSEVRAGSVVNCKVQNSSTLPSSVWVPGSVIPRGLMVIANRTSCGHSNSQAFFSQRISSHVTADALSQLAGILCFWRVIASHLSR